MLWQQDRNKKHIIIAPIDSRSISLSHGFSDHPFTNNSKMNENIFIPSSTPSYSPELWHYGVKGMHWGEITKKDKLSGYRRQFMTSRPKDEAATIKETVAKVAKLQNIKKKIQQQRINKAGTKVVRVGNKVISFHRKPRKTKEQIVESGANKINKMIEKTNNRIDKGIDFSSIFDKFMKKKLG